MGGPVETERGFVLHSAEYRSVMQTLDIAEGFSMTATLDILEDIARGKGPERALLALGYAGWGAEQLGGRAQVAGNRSAGSKRDAGKGVVTEVPRPDVTGR